MEHSRKRALEFLANNRENLIDMLTEFIRITLFVIPKNGDDSETHFG